MEVGEQKEIGMNEPEVEHDIKVHMEPKTRKHYAMIDMDDLLRILRLFEYQRRKVGLYPEQRQLYDKLRRTYFDSKSVYME